MIHVVGIGLDGAAGLTDSVRQIVEKATFLVGSDRHISYFPNHPAKRLVIRDFTQAIEIITSYLSNPLNLTVVLVTGDPLFFGLGRLLLEKIPAEHLTFHPHLSSVQLAFSRIKVSWQDARIISAHGRSLDELTTTLQQGANKIAVLTDPQNTPQAIALLLLALDLPSSYQFWVCENLGGDLERVQSFSLKNIDLLIQQSFADLNVVVLIRQADFDETLSLNSLPLIGIPDSYFLSFSDRPGLMTKREVRTLVLGELALTHGQTIWDIGAGTGSVSIEIARLFPSSSVYAIEKTSAGTTLIQQNCQRFQVNNVSSIHGAAPEVLKNLPAPNRIFIGGSGGNLLEILEACNQQLAPEGILVMALATLEHLNIALNWMREHKWNYRLLQVQLSRSVPIGQLTRFSPLNPVTVLTAKQSAVVEI